MSLYKILECQPNATQVQLREAYHRAALIHHPDKGGSSEKFASISAAYRILSNDSTRRVYDATLIESGVPVHADLLAENLTRNLDIYTYDCRCGGSFAMHQSDMSENECVLVPCDTCSLHIRVWAIP